MKAFPPPRGVQIYNPGLRALHWLMAALIFVALPLGVWASLLPRGEQRSEVLLIHKSIGVTVLGLVALRIVWRIITGARAYAEPLGRLTHAAARGGHLALYALMIAMPVSGYLTSTAGGNAVSWFGLFTLPRVVGKDKFLDEAASWAPCLRMGHCVRAGRASWRGRLARGHQARFRVDAHVAELPAGLTDCEIVMGSAFRTGSRSGLP
jgi:cytochrome b561